MVLFLCVYFLWFFSTEEKYENSNPGVSKTWYMHLLQNGKMAMENPGFVINVLVMSFLSKKRRISIAVSQQIHANIYHFCFIPRPPPPKPSQVGTFCKWLMSHSPSIQSQPASSSGSRMPDKSSMIEESTEEKLWENMEKPCLNP